jgi:desulfoferrodoxin (superoxide reductase-like protein)
MLDRRTFLTGAGSFFAAMGIAGESLANKSSVKIEAPESSAKGSEITIKLHVSHDGNSFTHYTEWVKVSINGKEAKKWEFSAFSKPEDEKFTRELKHKVDGPLEIVAQASCNNHGSSGPATHTVKTA